MSVQQSNEYSMTQIKAQIPQLQILNDPQGSSRAHEISGHLDSLTSDERRD